MKKSETYPVNSKSLQHMIGDVNLFLSPVDEDEDLPVGLMSLLPLVELDATEEALLNSLLRATAVESGDTLVEPVSIDAVRRLLDR